MVAWSGMDAAPQSRDRIYVVCTRGTRPVDLSFAPPCWCPSCERKVDGVQTWKNGRTVGKYRQQYLYACPSCRADVWPLVLPAAAAIDWTIGCPRIGDRAKPLAPATVRRIAAGLERFGPSAVIQAAGHTFERRPGVRTWPVTAPLPTQMTSAMHGLVVDTLFAGDGRARPAGWPLPTQTGRQSLAFVSTLRGQSGSHPLDEPLGTVSAGGIHHGLVEPFVAELRGGWSETRSVADTLATVTASGNHHGLVVGPDHAFVSKGYGDGRDPSMAILPSSPLATVTARDHHALVAVPFVTDYHGKGRARPVTDPLGTVDCTDRYAIVNPRVAVDDCGFRMLTPDEIGRAQAFPGTYAVTGTARDRVRMYGNAVSPPAAGLIAERVMAALDGAP
jgi:DNA (cytosine-5)-methyltransferase 1